MNCNNEQKFQWKKKFLFEDEQKNTEDLTQMFLDIAKMEYQFHQKLDFGDINLIFVGFIKQKDQIQPLKSINNYETVFFFKKITKK